MGDVAEIIMSAYEIFGGSKDDPIVVEHPSPGRSYAIPRDTEATPAENCGPRYDGAYQGVGLYDLFLSTVGTTDVLTVTLHQDGATPPSLAGGGGGLGGFGTLSSVYEIQGSLIALGYDLGIQDGISGPKTTNAIRAFQLDNGLTADGVVDSPTRAALAAALAAAGLL